jgi:hypothetical protein
MPAGARNGDEKQPWRPGRRDDFPARPDRYQKRRRGRLLRVHSADAFNAFEKIVAAPVAATPISPECDVFSTFENSRTP